MNKLERFRRRRLSNVSARIMVTMLREVGIRPEPALAEAGLRAADIHSSDAAITGDQELRLERAFVDLLVRCKGRWPTIEETGEKIGVSSRTLRRRLEEQGTSYSALLEEVRRKQAEELVARTSLTIEQVADSLGYAETASFTHAFKRWTGRSPRQFRSARGEA